MKQILALILFASTAFAQTTPNMSLVKPQVGIEPGPTWAEKLNTAFDTVDLHDHSAGKGVKVTPSGINITGDLEFNGNDATELRTTTYSSQSGTLSAADVGAVYNYGGNLYWNNGSGVAVQITSGTAVNNTVSGAFAASTPGAYPYTVTAGDAQKVLLVDTSASRTINLPAATTAVLFAIKDITGLAGTNAITVARAGADTIDGVGASRSLKSNYGWWFFVSDGVSNWSVSEGLGIGANGQIPVGNGAGFQLATLTGTSNQVTVTNGAGSITLATPQNIHTGASPTFAGATYSGLTASLPVFTDGSKALTSPSIATAWTALNAGATWTSYSGTISVSGDGTLTLSSTSINRATSITIGKETCIVVDFNGTISGTPSNKVGMTLPFDSAATHGTFAVSMSTPSNIIAGSATYTAANILALRKYDDSNYANGAYVWRVSGCYERT